jgi:hypothetical protein
VRPVVIPTAQLDVSRFGTRHDAASPHQVSAALGSRRGLADHSVQDVFEFYATREEAERMLKLVLRDEPELQDMLSVVPIDYRYDEAYVEAV